MVTVWSPAPEGAQLWFMDSNGPGMQMIRPHGRIGGQAARCVVLRGEFRAYSGLRVPLRVPPCGATRLQRALTFEVFHLTPLGSPWISLLVQGRALELGI